MSFHTTVSSYHILHTVSSAYLCTQLYNDTCMYVVLWGVVICKVICYVHLYVIFQPCSSVLHVTPCVRGCHQRWEEVEGGGGEVQSSMFDSSTSSLSCSSYSSSSSSYRGFRKTSPGPPRPLTTPPSAPWVCVSSTVSNQLDSSLNPLPHESSSGTKVWGLS